MSIADAPLRTSPQQPTRPDDHNVFEGSKEAIQQAVEHVAATIAPVWPLKDYVAVNPYFGLADEKFLAARRTLSEVSDMETLMPVDYYRGQFADGLLGKSDIDAAVDELVADGIVGAENIDVNQVLALLLEESKPSPTADAPFAKAANPHRLRRFSETLDAITQSNWGQVICEEVSKHCSAHYDEGQAAWASPWRDLTLYEAWRCTARHDRTFEILGVSGFRRLVDSLPNDTHMALAALLTKLRVPVELWEKLLLCQAFALPGWNAWARYQDRQAEQQGGGEHLVGLLVMQLAYEAALFEQFDSEVDWSTSIANHSWNNPPSLDLASLDGEAPSAEELLRYALLRATEIAFRKRLLSAMAAEQNEPLYETGKSTNRRRLAQMVFCIDVRSERIRRQLEATSTSIETFGFAGFFALPIEFVGLGESCGAAQVPVLISPHFAAHEEIDGACAATTEAAAKDRSVTRFLRKTWKDFQASAASCFAFVETTGLFYGFKLVARSLGWDQAEQSRFDGVKKEDRDRLGPTLRSLSEQGVTTSRQADLAASILRGIGIVEDFGKLVVFCGHGSQTENNPLQAGLDCGACGGHSGEANARLAAKLLNQPTIRQELAERGIVIPDDTHFVAGLHNTTTDELEFFDEHDIPQSHWECLWELKSHAVEATERTRTERLAVLPGQNGQDLVRRSRDWSEVRPEWGLAGNAAFIVAPRELTQSFSLKGRSFLHSYDYRNDPEFAVLTQIMTAPMIVGNWINMQYYASTVDPIHFGSGNKTVHNVVGKFGVLSGNSGDLMTGLPWQSLHDGQQYQHHPLRLLAVIAAPRYAIESIIAEHEVVENLLTNGWLQLIAVEDNAYYRYTEQQNWDDLRVGELSLFVG